MKECGKEGLCEHAGLFNSTVDWKISGVASLKQAVLCMFSWKNKLSQKICLTANLLQQFEESARLTRLNAFVKSMKVI